MQKEYIQTFAELLVKHFKNTRKLSSDEIDFLCDYFQNNYANEFTEYQTKQGFSRYAMKFTICRLALTVMPLTNFPQLATFTADILRGHLNAINQDLDVIDDVFRLKPLEASTSDFSRYIEQLAKTTYSEATKPCEAQIKAIYTTLIFMAWQLRGESDDDLAVYLFYTHFRENRLDLDYLLGVSDLLSDRLAKHINTEALQT